MKVPKFVKETTSKKDASSVLVAKEMQIRQRYGPKQEGGVVTFTAFYPEAKKVFLAGDFNNWQPEKNPMRRMAGDVWQVKVPLAKGYYRYRFVVDGKWQQDPYNNGIEPNPYGELNSVINVS